MVVSNSSANAQGGSTRTASLGKLPPAAAHAAAEKYLAGAAGQNDPYIGAETVLIDVIGGELGRHIRDCSISPAACGPDATFVVPVRRKPCRPVARA